MENSNTLPKIEEATHTVIINDTFCAYSYSFYDSHMSIDDFVRAIEKGLGIEYFNKELVYSRINKPTKERVYSEQEMFDFANSYADNVMGGMIKTPSEYLSEYIESLNK